MGEPSPLALSAGQLRSCNGPKIGAEKLRPAECCIHLANERGWLRLFVKTLILPGAVWSWAKRLQYSSL